MLWLHVTATSFGASNLFVSHDEVLIANTHLTHATNLFYFLLTRITYGSPSYFKLIYVVASSSVHIPLWMQFISLLFFD